MKKFSLVWLLMVLPTLAFAAYDKEDCIYIQLKIQKLEKIRAPDPNMWAVLRKLEEVICPAMFDVVEDEISSELDKIQEKK